jgi:hypothetical protein
MFDPTPCDPLGNSILTNVSISEANTSNAHFNLLHALNITLAILLSSLMSGFGDFLLQNYGRSSWLEAIWLGRRRRAAPRSDIRTSN